MNLELIKIIKSAARKLIMPAFVSVIAACSSPVNMVESKTVSGQIGERLTLSAISQFKPIENSDESHGFKMLAHECQNCNRHIMIFVGEPSTQIESYNTYLQAMQDFGFAILTVAPPASFGGEVICRQSYPDDPDRLDRCLTITRNDQAKMLSKLVEESVVGLADSNEVWGNFLTAERGFSWSNAVIAGHGRSAAPALMLAFKHKVSRLCTLHGPFETNSPMQGASWLATTPATPSRRMYFMTHKHDGGKDALQKIEAVVRKIGINTLATSWTRPSDQLLYASLQGESCADPSSCLVQDPIPVDASGQPIYLEAWKYLCLPPGN